MNAENMTLSVPVINPEQGARCLALGWQARVPITFVGGVGSGKTTIPTDFIKKMNEADDAAHEYKLWMNPLSFFADAGDVSGIPFPQDGRMKYLMNENMPFDTTEHGIMVGDELDRCREEVQNAFLQVLLGGEIHGHKLSPNCYVVGTMNGSSDIYTTQLSEAAATRMCSLFLSHKAAGYQDSYDEWASANGVGNVARTFSKFRAELLHPVPEFEEMAICVPRTVDMADRILQAAKVTSVKTSDIIYPMLAGVIGRKAATEFLAVEKLIDEAPPLEDIWRHPESADIPENPSVVYALVCGLTDSTKRENLNAVAHYGTRLPVEFAAMMFKRMSRNIPAIVTTVKFQEWQTAHKELLI